MKSSGLIALIAIACTAAGGDAQTLARNVTSTDGTVQVLFPSTPAACGDGQSYIRMSRGRSHGQTIVDNNVFYGRDNWGSRPCVSGQGRVLATVIDGEVTRLNVFVGPVPTSAAGTRTITASAADAAAWLGDLLRPRESRVASKAISALMFVDAPPPWPLLLNIARDRARPRDTQRHAMVWLSSGVQEKLGLSDVDENGSDDAELRAQAVFVLSQRPKSESVPELIDLARTAKNPVVRKTAIFWLGQSGDPRAADVYAELLGIR